MRQSRTHEDRAIFLGHLPIAAGEIREAGNHRTIAPA
jgi:hypothetical protein